jgi:hypothetical protein
MNKPLPPLPVKGLDLWDLPAWLAARGLRAVRFVWVWVDVAECSPHGRGPCSVPKNGRVEVLALEVEALDSPPYP